MPLSELHLRKFDMARVRDDSVVVAIGRRGSGKSWAVRELLSYHSDIPTGLVISPTEQANCFFGEFIPRLLIHDAFSNESVANVIERQKRAVAKARAEQQLGADPLDPRAFVVLDDCNYDSKWVKNDDVRFLFMNGRHVKIFLIITMQYCLGLPPNLRSNVDYAFIFRDTNIANRRRIFENFVGCVDTFEIFCQICDACTQDRDFLVVDNSSTSGELTDCLFWYKCDTPEPFRMCPPQLWQLSEQVVDRDPGGPELFDIEKLRKVKHKIKVVKKR